MRERASGGVVRSRVVPRISNGGLPGVSVGTVGCVGPSSLCGERARGGVVRVWSVVGLSDINGAGLGRQLVALVRKDGRAGVVFRRWILLFTYGPWGGSAGLEVGEC